MLEENGVGGVIHYLLREVDEQNKRINFSEFRISFVDHWLEFNVIDRLSHPPKFECKQEIFAFLDESALPINETHNTYDPEILFESWVI